MLLTFCYKLLRRTGSRAAAGPGLLQNRDRCLSLRLNAGQRRQNRPQDTGTPHWEGRRANATGCTSRDEGPVPTVIQVCDRQHSGWLGMIIQLDYSTQASGIIISNDDRWSGRCTGPPGR